VTDSFDVVAAEYRHESDPIKGSRFVATVSPAPTPAEAEAVVARVRAADPNATHHCWAYRTGRPCDRFRFSDDGEPGGSAGRPILQQIEGHGLTDTVVVVTRWFGGTKLGIGGLIRAYGGCTARALDLAPKKTLLLTRRVAASFPYECLSAVQRVLAAHQLEPLEAEYGEAVAMTLEVPVCELEDFRRELRDRTAGRIQLD